MSRVLFSLVALSGVVGCVELGEDEATETIDQGLSLTFRYRSASVPSQIMDTIGATSGALARLVPPGAAPDQQRWFFDGTLVHSNQQQSVCLQPETNALGARVLLRPCDRNNPLQGWGFVKMPGNRVQMQNLETYGVVDAAAGAFGVLRANQRSATSLTQQFTLE